MQNEVAEKVNLLVCASPQHVILCDDPALRDEPGALDAGDACKFSEPSCCL